MKIGVEKRSVCRGSFLIVIHLLASNNNGESETGRGGRTCQEQIWGPTFLPSNKSNRDSEWAWLFEIETWEKWVAKWERIILRGDGCTSQQRCQESDSGVEQPGKWQKIHRNGKILNLTLLKSSTKGNYRLTGESMNQLSRFCGLCPIRSNLANKS